MHSNSSKVGPGAEQGAVPRSQTGHTKLNPSKLNGSTRPTDERPRSQTGRTKLNPAKLNGSTRPTDERPRVTRKQAVCTQAPRKSSQVQSKKQYQGRRLGAQSSIQPNSTVPLVQRMRGPGLRRDRQYALKSLESRARCRARSSTKVADWAHKAQSFQAQRFHSSNG
jgi:hypothetical protein